MLLRPENTYESIAEDDPNRPDLPKEVTDQVQIQLKYAGYIERQMQQVEKFHRQERKQLPQDMDYLSIEGLRIEARQKLQAVKPISIGQAERISGVSPADISVLLVYLEQQSRARQMEETRETENESTEEVSP